MVTRHHGEIVAGEREPAPPASLRIDDALVAEIVSHLRATLPHEGCGLLAFASGGPDEAVATRYYPGTNLDASPTRYTMDPREVLTAFRDIDANGWTFGAIVHSHLATPPMPSPTDLREAFYPEALMVIVSFAAPTPEMRAWRLAGSPPATAPVEAPIRVATPTSGE